MLTLQSSYQRPPEPAAVSLPMRASRQAEPASQPASPSGAMPQEREQQHLNGMPANPKPEFPHKGKRLISSIVVCIHLLLRSYVFGSVSY